MKALWASSQLTTRIHLGPLHSPLRCLTDHTVMSSVALRVLEHAAALRKPRTLLPVRTSLKVLYSRFTVSSGSFAATVPARSAIAIYTGALGKGSSGAGTTSGTGSGSSSTVAVTFDETATTTFGQVKST